MNILTGGGSVACCGPSTCHIANSKGFHFPNRLVKGQDGLYYVPRSTKNKIRVMQLRSDFTLVEVAVIRIGIPIENLSVDKAGAISAAVFPQAYKMLASERDPYNVEVPSAILRIRKLQDGEYEVKKILEDHEGRVMGGVTVARHDVRTGRLFMGGRLEIPIDKVSTDSRMNRCSCAIYYNM